MAYNKIGSQTPISLATDFNDSQVATVEYPSFIRLDDSTALLTYTQFDITDATDADYFGHIVSVSPEGVMSVGPQVHLSENTGAGDEAYTFPTQIDHVGFNIVVGAVSFESKTANPGAGRGYLYVWAVDNTDITELQAYDQDTVLGGIDGINSTIIGLGDGRFIMHYRDEIDDWYSVVGQCDLTTGAITWGTPVAAGSVDQEFVFNRVRVDEETVILAGWTRIWAEKATGLVLTRGAEYDFPVYDQWRVWQYKPQADTQFLHLVDDNGDLLKVYADPTTLDVSVSNLGTVPYSPYPPGLEDTWVIWSNSASTSIVVDQNGKAIISGVMEHTTPGTWSLAATSPSGVLTSFDQGDVDGYINAGDSGYFYSDSIVLSGFLVVASTNGLYPPANESNPYGAIGIHIFSTDHNPFAPSHLYLPLMDENGNVYREASISLIDPNTGAAITTPVYSDIGLTARVSFPLPVTDGYIKLWSSDPMDAIVRVQLSNGQYNWYSSFTPSGDETARGEETLQIQSSDNDAGSILTKVIEDQHAAFLGGVAGIHTHRGQGDDATRLGPVRRNTADNSSQLNSAYPRSVSLGEGYGMAGEDGVVVGAGERTPNWEDHFGEPSQEVVLSDYGSYTPQSVWIARSANWDEGGREMTVLLRQGSSAYMLAERSTALGGMASATSGYGDNQVWIGSMVTAPDGVFHNTVWIGSVLTPPDAFGYSGVVSIGTVPERLLWGAQPAPTDPTDAIAIGIDGAVSDHLGNFVDYGADGYAYDLGDEDPTVPTPTPLFIRNTEADIPGGLTVTGDAVVGHSELADAVSALLGFYGSAGVVRDSIPTLPGDPPALTSLMGALTKYGLVLSTEAPLLADSFNRADGLVGYAQTGQVRESVAVSANPTWDEDVEIVTSAATRAANFTSSPVVSTYSTPISDVVADLTVESWGSGNTDAGIFIRGIYDSVDVVPIDGLLAGKNGLYKVEGGASLVFTLLMAYAAQPDGVDMRVKAVGDTVEVFSESVSLGSVVTTWAQTGKRHGYVLGAGGASVSEFTVSMPKPQVEWIGYNSDPSVNPSVTVPAGFAAGDLIVATAFGDGTITLDTAGFTSYLDTTLNGDEYKIWTKTADGLETTIDWTADGGTFSRVFGAVFVIRNGALRSVGTNVVTTDTVTPAPIPEDTVPGGGMALGIAGLQSGTVSGTAGTWPSPYIAGGYESGASAKHSQRVVYWVNQGDVDAATASGSTTMSGTINVWEQRLIIVDPV